MTELFRGQSSYLSTATDLFSRVAASLSKNQAPSVHKPEFNPLLGPQHSPPPPDQRKVSAPQCPPGLLPPYRSLLGPNTLRKKLPVHPHHQEVSYRGFSHNPYHAEKSVFYWLFHVPLAWAPSGAQAQGLGAFDTTKGRAATAN